MNNNNVYNKKVLIVGLGMIGGSYAMGLKQKGIIPYGYDINSETIDKMKKDAILINTSRGALVDSIALLNGLKEKKIMGAALDVYEEEANLFFEDNSTEIIQSMISKRTKILFHKTTYIKLYYIILKFSIIFSIINISS